MIIEIKKIASDIKIHVPDLITRSVGRRMYKKVGKQLQYISDGETVLLDFAKIKVIDPSFIDEFVVRLILDSRGDEKVFFIKLINVSDIAELNMESVFHSYNSYNEKKMVVSTDNLMSNNCFFIGQLSDLEKDVVGYFKINKSADVNEIADFLSVKNDEAERILNELNILRLVRKSYDKDVELFLQV